MTLKALSGQHLQVGVVPQKSIHWEEIVPQVLGLKMGGHTWPQDMGTNSLSLRATCSLLLILSCVCFSWIILRPISTAHAFPL